MRMLLLLLLLVPRIRLLSISLLSILLLRSSIRRSSVRPSRSAIAVHGCCCDCCWKERSGAVRSPPPSERTSEVCLPLHRNRNLCTLSMSVLQLVAYEARQRGQATLLWPRGSAPFFQTSRQGSTTEERRGSEWRRGREGTHDCTVRSLD